MCLLYQINLISAVIDSNVAVHFFPLYNPLEQCTNYASSKLKLKMEATYNLDCSFVQCYMHLYKIIYV